MDLSAGARGELVEQIFEDRLERHEGLSNGDNWRKSTASAKAPRLDSAWRVWVTRRPAWLGSRSEGQPGKSEGRSCRALHIPRLFSGEYGSHEVLSIGDRGLILFLKESIWLCMENGLSGAKREGGQPERR